MELKTRKEQLPGRSHSFLETQALEETWVSLIECTGLRQALLLRGAQELREGLLRGTSVHWSRVQWGLERPQGRRSTGLWEPGWSTTSFCCLAGRGWSWGRANSSTHSGLTLLGPGGTLPQASTPLHERFIPRVHCASCHSKSGPFCPPSYLCLTFIFSCFSPKLAIPLKTLLPESHSQEDPGEMGEEKLWFSFSSWPHLLTCRFSLQWWMRRCPTSFVTEC